MVKKYVRCERCKKPVQNTEINLVPTTNDIFRMVGLKAKDEMVCESCLKEMMSG